MKAIRTMIGRFTKLSATSLFAFIALCPLLALAQGYNLFPLSEGSGLEPKGINAVGQLASSAGGRAFRYTYSTNTYLDLGTLGGTTSSSFAINAAGQVIGYSTDQTGQPKGFFWSSATGMVDLGSTFIGGGALPSAINASGVVVGRSLQTPLFPYQAPGNCPPTTLCQRAFIWTINGGMTDLGTLSGDKNSSASDINNSGQVVGWSQASSGSTHAFLWSQGAMNDLGDLGGGMSFARAINDNGQVVGSSVSLTGQTRAFLWTNGGMLDLGGDGNCSATAINNAGQVLGTCSVSGGFPQPIVWTPSGSIIPLTIAGGLTVASGQNGSGVVVGRSLVSGVFGSFVFNGSTIENLDNDIPNAPSGTHLSAAWAIGDDGTIAASLSPTYQLALLQPLSPPPGSTPTGVAVPVEITASLPDGTSSSVNISFEQVSSAGITAVSTSANGPTPPTGYKLGDPAVYYDVSTTAQYSGSISICFGWIEGQFIDESALRLWHFDGSVWQDVTTSVDTTNDIACGTVTSLSPFALMEVAYQFSGFYAPIANLPAVNTIKAGSAVPVKFSLGGNYGLNVFAATYPQVKQVACSAASTVDINTQTITAGNSSLNYDAPTGQYIYVWKTDKAWAGACAQLLVLFTDGTLREASFQLTQ